MFHGELQDVSLFQFALSNLRKEITHYLNFFRKRNASSSKVATQIVPALKLWFSYLHCCCSSSPEDILTGPDTGLCALFAFFP